MMTVAEAELWPIGLLCTTATAMSATCTSAIPAAGVGKNWIVARDRLARLNAAIVVAGYNKSVAPESPATIENTKRYVQHFDVDVRIPAAINHIKG